MVYIMSSYIFIDVESNKRWLWLKNQHKKLLFTTAPIKEMFNVQAYFTVV